MIPRRAGHVPKVLRERSERLRRLLAEPDAVAQALASSPVQSKRPGSAEQVLAAAMRQHMPADLVARLAIAKRFVELLQRFRYEETGAIATLLLALDADEAIWIQVLQATAELLQGLLEATREDQAEELYAYGVSEAELPALARDIERVITPYLG